MSFSLLLEITLTVTLNFIWPPEWSDGTGSAQQSNNVRRSDNHGGKLCQKVILFSCSCFFVYISFPVFLTFYTKNYGRNEKISIIVTKARYAKNIF